LTSPISNPSYVLVNNIQTIDSLGDYASKQIITFDYNSHIFLTKKNISHITSDQFYSIGKLGDIENKIYSFMKWYEISSIKDEIISDEINLGELFFLEFRDVLVSFLKIFIEISNLVKLNLNSTYYVSKNLAKFILPLTKNVIELNQNTDNTSIYDSTDIPLKFGSKQLTIKVSKKNLSRIQIFLNHFLQIISSKNFFNKNSLSILVVNFSTIKNKEFLLEKSNFNIIKYDRTNPSIWDRNSFNIIKNSNCIIENETTLLDKKSLDTIKNNKNDYLLKIQSIISSKDLEIFFSLNELNFWKQIKPFLLELCTKRFLDAAKEIELAKMLLNKYSFSKILLLHESGMTEQIILQFAKKQKVPTFVLQHGLFFDTNQMINDNHFQRTIPKKSDYFLVWGDYMKNYLLNNNIKFNKIKVIGSIFFDGLFQKNFSSTNNSESILLASDPLAFNRIIDLSINQKELYNKTIEEISKITSSLNKKLIIKTHPQKNQNEEDITKKIDPSIVVNHSGDIHPLIESSDLVIVTDMSTVIVEAMIMQKPVISIRMKDHYGKPEIFNYCTQIPLESLDSWLKLFYKDPEIKINLIKKGNEFLNKHLKNHGNASSEVLKFLEEI
jgi:hypothetical protein